MTEATDRMDDFERALDTFKTATRKLDEAWKAGVSSDVFGDTYPAWAPCAGPAAGIIVGLPSFDEFAVLVQQMRIDDAFREPLPRHDPPEIGATVLTRSSVDRTPFVTVPANWTGTVTHVGGDRIEVIMDRYLGAGGHEHGNAIHCTSEHAPADAPWGTRLDAGAVAAAVFHLEFRIVS